VDKHSYFKLIDVTNALQKPALCQWRSSLKKNLMVRRCLVWNCWVRPAPLRQ